MSDREYMQNVWRNLCYVQELLKQGEMQSATV